MVLVALLDANVLFPFFLRDTLLRVAAVGCYRLHWSQEILDEMARNLMKQHRVTEKQALALMEQMERAFPDAKVDGWKHRVARMENDPKDRHVAAAAEHVSASVIVTSNTKDFKKLPLGLTAVSPDEFLLGLFSSVPDQVMDALEAQVAAYRYPPSTISDLLDILENSVPKLALAVKSTLAGAGLARS